MRNDADHIIKLQRDLDKCLCAADKLEEHLAAAKIAEAQDALKELRPIACNENGLDTRRI